jgi:hypothetical protein
VVPAALGLVALMVGATVTNVAILHTSPATPVIFLLVAGLVAAGRPRRRDPHNYTEIAASSAAETATPV